MKCVSCNTPLSGGLDTFGDAPNELCWECYSTLLWDPECDPIIQDMLGFDVSYEEIKGLYTERKDK